MTESSPELDETAQLIGEDGERHRYVQDFAATFYAAGPSPRLRELWKWFKAQSVPVCLKRIKRKDVFKGMTTVLAVEVVQPVKLDGLFRNTVVTFPDLTYYDADISLPLRYVAAFDVFPLARCRLEVRGDTIVSITPLDTPWDLEPDPAPLRILTLEPDCDPAHREPE